MTNDFEEMIRRLALELRWLPFDKQEREIKALPARVQAALLRCWFWQARDKQLPLDALATSGSYQRE